MIRLALLALLAAQPALAAAPDFSIAPRPRGEAVAPPTTEDAAADAPAAEAPPPPPGKPSAALRGLDKFSGLATQFYAPLNEQVAYARLRITARACVVGADGPAVYLEIVDAKPPGTLVFAGWMFAESPALSALDHPRYDVWLASCATSAGVAD